MKPSIFVIYLFFSSCTLYGQAPSATNLFVHIDQAKEYANKYQANILLVFSGSDWCRPCMKFKKEILESEEFKNYADQNLAILYLDFPAKKKNRLSKELTQQNEKLADQFNQSGTFPKIILTNQSLQNIKALEFTTQTPKIFIDEINSK